MISYILDQALPLDPSALVLWLQVGLGAQELLGLSGAVQKLKILKEGDMKVMCEKATSPSGNPHMLCSFCCFLVLTILSPMDKLEDSDIYLAAAGLGAGAVLREHSGHGSGKWREVKGKARQL